MLPNFSLVTVFTCYYPPTTLLINTCDTFLIPVCVTVYVFRSLRTCESFASGSFPYQAALTRSNQSTRREEKEKAGGGERCLYLKKEKKNKFRGKLENDKVYKG